MAIGQIGKTGIFAVLRALVEHRVDLELVPIPRHEMEAVNAVERAKTYALAMKIHAQVNISFRTLYMSGQYTFFRHSQAGFGYFYYHASFD